MNSSEVRVDVREAIREGREPFSRIMAAAAQVGPGGKLVLAAPFEPVPLYGVLGGHGFTHAARELADGSWEICFSRAEEPSAPASEKGFD